MVDRRDVVAAAGVLALAGCAVAQPDQRTRDGKTTVVDVTPDFRIEVTADPASGVASIRLIGANGEKFLTEIDAKARHVDPAFDRGDAMIEVRDLTTGGKSDKKWNRTTLRLRFPIGARIKGEPLRSHSGHARPIIIEC